MRAKSEAIGHKILIIGPAWVGDMVMAQTLFKLLKQQRPECIIDVVAPEWSRPLLERMPEVRQAIALAVGHGQLKLKERYHLAKSLRQQQYDQAIVLANSFKSAFIPFWAKIPLRTGWLGEMRWGLLNDVRYLNKKALPLMIERFAALGIANTTNLPEELPWPSLQVSDVTVAAALQKFGLRKVERPVLALCPGAEFGPAKRWPSHYYAELARQKLALGWEVWLFGSTKDQIVTQEIQQQTQHACIDLAGKTTLAEAIDLLSVVNAVVSNDSGLMHIAAALQRPLIVVYGSSDPRFTPPLAARVKILSLNLECSPCFERECPLGHMKCLNDLPAYQVLQALDDLTSVCGF